jgi:hypothetical protein
MDTLRFGRTVAALGILFVFIFWGFAVSLAHDALPTVPLTTIDLRVAHEFDSSQAERSALTMGMDVVTGLQPKTSRLLLERCVFGFAPSIEPITAFASAHMAPVKVSLPISKSVLLL